MAITARSALVSLAPFCPSSACCGCGPVLALGTQRQMRPDLALKELTVVQWERGLEKQHDGVLVQRSSVGSWGCGRLTQVGRQVDLENASWNEDGMKDVLSTGKA